MSGSGKVRVCCGVIVGIYKVAVAKHWNTDGLRSHRDESVNWRTGLAAVEPLSFDFGARGIGPQSTNAVIC